MPTVPLAAANMLTSASGLGAILGVTDRRVRQLRSDGILKVAKSRLNGMHFRLGESVQRFLQYEHDLVIEQCAERNGELEKARTRKVTAEAAMAELELKAKQGEYLRRDDVGFHLTLMITACKQRLLAIPSRVMHRLVGLTKPVEANQIVNDEIYSALTELSESKFNVASTRRRNPIHRSTRNVDAPIRRMGSSLIRWRFLSVFPQDFLDFVRRKSVAQTVRRNHWGAHVHNDFALRQTQNFLDRTSPNFLRKTF